MKNFLLVKENALVFLKLITKNRFEHLSGLLTENVNFHRSVMLSVNIMKYKNYSIFRLS